MPKIVEYGKFVYGIFSADKRKVRGKSEPKHVHVLSKKKGRVKFAKIWLEPEIKVDDIHKGDFTEQELNKIIKILEKEDVKEFIDEGLANFYNDLKVKFKKFK
ncbi:MAG: hypothetical protein FVQ77_05875 [Cytophagales bacterium]|nr:hypothetical protein [Cytophagales bacterium]